MQSSVKGLERAMKKRIVRMGSNARHASLVTASEKTLEFDNPPIFLKSNGGIVLCILHIPYMAFI